MAYLDRDQDTVFALSTPPGRGGLAVLRISGDIALEVSKRHCKFLPKTPETHRVFYGFFRSAMNEEIDEVLVSYFAHGKSFTGEETIEISCHGSPVIVSTICEELLQSGCRNAERGEFTYRAFVNGKIDLVQAESVLDLIESKSKSAARMATRLLKGELSSKFLRLENDLTWMLANMEADIDFSTEDIQPFDFGQLISFAENSLNRVESLIESFKKGRSLSKGMSLVIVGRPNSGKSSLLNTLIDENRAIVTDVAGTTRDLIQAEFQVDGVLVSVTDTAGLHETENVVEKIGIKKTKEAAETADVILLVVDTSDRKEIANQLILLQPSESQKIMVLGNKIDLSGIDEIDFQKIICNVPAAEGLRISVKTGENIDKLNALIKREVHELLVDDAPLVLSSRQFEKLMKIRESVEKTISLLKENASPEFTSFELQCGLRAAQELLGKVYDDQVMDRVFQEFCIGK